MCSVVHVIVTRATQQVSNSTFMLDKVRENATRNFKFSCYLWPVFVEFCAIYVA